MNQSLEVLILANKNYKTVIAQFKADCKGNGIELEIINPTKFRIPNTPKSKMAVRMVRERLGMNNVVTKEVVS